MQIMEALIFMVRTLGTVLIYLVLARLLLQLSRADFYNPISQAIVKLTSPVIVPLRRIIPAIGRLDTASVMLAALIQLAVVLILLLLSQQPLQPVAIALWTVMSLIGKLLDFYFYVFIGLVILSWVAPYSRQPLAILIAQLSEPVLAPIRRVIPPMGGLDFSVMAATLLIYMLQRFIFPPMPF